MSVEEKPLYLYLFSYQHQGREWLFEIEAYDAEDARLRVNRMSFATYEGVREGKDVSPA